MQSLTRISLTLLGLLLLGAALFMAGTRQSLAQSPALPDLGPAPDFNNEVWINSSRLRLSDLRGQVVLVNFWTFDCYNCKNVLPYVRQWNDTYAQKGLTTIGVHFPEFSYEANLDNLKAAVKALGVNWAVAQDNDGLTWRAYQNRYWPTLYLIDKTGRLRYLHIGEGAYEQTERAIQSLLAEPFDVNLAKRNLQKFRASRLILRRRTSSLWRWLYRQRIKPTKSPSMQRRAATSGLSG